MAARDAGNPRFVRDLFSILATLETWLDAGRAESPEADVLWRALRACLPLAAQSGPPRRRASEEELDEHQCAALRLVRDRRWLRRGRRRADPESERLIRLTRMAFESLEIYLLSHCSPGWNACYDLLKALVELLDAPPDRRITAGDRQPRRRPAERSQGHVCAPHPATVPEAFLTDSPIGERAREAAAARAFLERVQPSELHQKIFHGGCLEIAAWLERQLKGGAIDLPREDVLWRMLRAFLPLVDPQWTADHAPPPEELVGQERDLVSGLGRYLTGSGPEELGERVRQARGRIHAAAVSAEKIYLYGLCPRGARECAALMAALRRSSQQG